MPEAIEPCPPFWRHIRGRAELADHGRPAHRRSWSERPPHEQLGPDQTAAGHHAREPRRCRLVFGSTHDHRPLAPTGPKANVHDLHWPAGVTVTIQALVG